MKAGVHSLNFDVPGEAEALPTTPASAATAAERTGAAWFTVADHLFHLDTFWAAESPMLQAHTSLGHLAGHTERIKLVALVNDGTYRHPKLPAKTAATPLDVLACADVGVAVAGRARA